MDNTHAPIPIEEWKGLFVRGTDDSTPDGYFLDSLNVRFSESSARTRDGSERVFTTPSIVRFSIYKRIGETPRFIFLNSSGQLFDSLFPTVPIWTDASFVDFSGANFNGRYYITPHNRVTGIPGKHILVYDGSGAARLAGGAAPVGFTLNVTNTPLSGNIEKGTHIIAVSFLTASGFITAPGPATFAILVANGGHSAQVQNLPIGPSGTVGRLLLSSKAIQDYNGNQLGYELFFIPSVDGGQVLDNVTTTTIVSYFDAELQADATYLLDNKGLIPAAVCITEYNGRMCIGGINGDEHTVYISKPFDPEQISTTSGFITVNPYDSNTGVTNIFTHRGNLIISKRNRLYQTFDNKDDPVTWTIPESVDEGAGTECFGVGTILDHKSQQNNWAIIADRSGLLVFQGYVTRPEGSWLINEVWKRINKIVFNKIQVVIDVETSSIYVSLPLDDSTTISHILYGYFADAWSSYGMDSMKIRWSLWTMAQGVVSISSDADQVTGSSVFLFSGEAGNIYKVANDFQVHSDEDVAFPSNIKTALYTTKPKWTQHLGLIGMRIIGNGILNTTAMGQDETNIKALTSKTMSLAPGRDIEIKANYQSTKISIKIATGDNINEYFTISRMDMYLKPMWQTTYDQTV